PKLMVRPLEIFQSSTAKKCAAVERKSVCGTVALLDARYTLDSGVPLPPALADVAGKPRRKSGKDRKRIDPSVLSGPFLNRLWKISAPKRRLCLPRDHETVSVK